VVVCFVISMIVNMVLGVVFEIVTSKKWQAPRLVSDIKNAGISISSAMVDNHFQGLLGYYGDLRQRITLGFLKPDHKVSHMIRLVVVHLNLPTTFSQLGFTVWRQFVHLVELLLLGPSFPSQNLHPIF
jgi:hypothetical protein